jgi:release factor glutamine methyltransferase
VIRTATERLRAAGSDTPDLDAQLLLQLALGVTKEELIRRGDVPVPATVEREYDALIARREAGEPVAYIVGRRFFADIELLVDRRVLIPRPDTETLVEAALDLPRGARVHDVGTGSGAVALALKDERPDLVVSGSDASPAAVEVARANAARLGLDVAFTVARGLPASLFPVPCSLVLANLPYVREDEWPDLAPEIRDYEPRGALVSGADGLDAIRELIAQAPAGTRLALEHAPDQSAAVRALLSDAHTLRDLAGRDRVTTGIVP